MTRTARREATGGRLLGRPGAGSCGCTWCRRTRGAGRRTAGMVPGAESDPPPSRPIPSEVRRSRFLRRRAASSTASGSAVRTATLTATGDTSTPRRARPAASGYTPCSAGRKIATKEGGGAEPLGRRSLRRRRPGPSPRSPLRNRRRPGGGGTICLSLDWDDRPGPSPAPSPRRTSGGKIVSSYSDGTVAVHDVHVGETSGGASASVVEETHRWDAHRLFGVPAEVWTACFGPRGFGGGDSSGTEDCDLHNPVVISGGDDCSLKVWDLRSSLSRPSVKVGSEEFEAGVTAVSSHLRLPHVFASGSYDETVRFWDVRNMGQPLCRCDVGGGVWRIRWHPHQDGTVLVAAMHGGCRIVEVTGLTGGGDAAAVGGGGGGGDGGRTASRGQVVAEFKEHESMAYGADWISSSARMIDAEGLDSCGTGEIDSIGDGNLSRTFVAASCSFYDRRAFIWDGIGSQ